MFLICYLHFLDQGDYTICAYDINSKWEVFVSEWECDWTLNYPAFIGVFLAQLVCNSIFNSILMINLMQYLNIFATKFHENDRPMTDIMTVLLGHLETFKICLSPII